MSDKFGKKIEKAFEGAKEGFEHAKEGSEKFIHKASDMSKDGLGHAKEGFEHAKEGSEKLLHKAGEIGGKTVEIIKKAPVKEWLDNLSGVWSTFATWLHTLRGSAMVAWLFTIGMGIALLPGIGFFVGILVGSQLTDEQKEELTQIFTSGPKWIQDLVNKLKDQIQSKWSDFTTRFSKDLHSWEDKEENVKKAADDITKQLSDDEEEDS